jgi:hypothetical protein
MPIYNRKTDPKVIAGKTQKKNRWTTSEARPFLGPTEIFVERRDPGKGYKHVVSRRQVTAFLSLLPDWGELSKGFRGVILDAGGQACDGWHSPGIVALCAWERDLWVSVDGRYYTEHETILAMLGVQSQCDDGEWVLKYTPEQATAFALVHVLLHELGHHHDRMSTRSTSRASRGEAYAERYAIEYAPLIWERYQDSFGW